MGGSEWNNNGRNIVVVHKDSKEDHHPYKITVDKVKPKHYGKLGECVLHIDWASQRFYEFDHIHNTKKYAYATEEIVVDPIKDIFAVSNDQPF
jgi:hypothetical protein